MEGWINVQTSNLPILQSSNKDSEEPMSEFCMPSLGADMDAGTLVEWKVKPGDPVKKGDVIAEVETHERRQFRIARELEIEKEREIRLNLEATEKVRRILNALSPRLNDDFAAIGVELDLRTKLIREMLKDEGKQELEAMVRELKSRVSSIENGVKGLLSLYKVMYARHSEEGEIETIRGEVEQKPVKNSVK